MRSSELKECGDFKKITENITTIFNIVKDSDFGKRLNFEQKLYAAGLLYLYPYIHRNEITINKVVMSVMFAGIGGMVLYPYRIILNPQADFSKNDILVNLIMQIEALVFNVESDFDGKTIIDTVIGQKKAISMAVERELSKGACSNMYKKISQYFMNCLEDLDFQGTILMEEDFV